MNITIIVAAQSIENTTKKATDGAGCFCDMVYAKY
jgi:hypothetical protein